jgi:hypothetical protein
MSLLGTYLENFYRPGDRFQSVWARVERRQQPSPSNPNIRRAPIGRLKAKASNANNQPQQLEFWAALPDRVRVAVTKSEGTTTTVTVGQKCWQLDPDGKVTFEEKSTPPRGVISHLLPTEYRRHFDPRLIRSLFESLTLEELGEVELAGQGCVRMRAVPIAGDAIWSHWLPTDADSFEFSGDLERGSLLGISALMGSREIKTYAVTHVYYDAAIDGDQFVAPHLSEGSATALVPVIQRVQLADVRNQLPFVIVLPGGEAAEKRFEFHLSTPRKAGATPSLMAFTHNPSQGIHFTLTAAGAEDGYEQFEWEEVHHGGLVYQLSDPRVSDGQKLLRFSKHGTTVTIISAKPLEELLQFAATFELVE